MKDSLKFKGVVTARNKDTGEVLFAANNCIVEGGRLITLAKAMNYNQAETQALAAKIDETNTDLISWFNSAEASNAYKIKHFKLGFDGNSDRASHPLAVNTQATNLDNYEAYPWKYGDIKFFTGNEEFIPTDVPEDQLNLQLVNRDSDDDTLFLRIKILAEMPGNEQEGEGTWENIDPETPLVYVHINQIGLYMDTTNEDSAMDNWLLFSMLKFPTVTLQASMKVEFEYRIYG